MSDIFVFVPSFIIINVSISKHFTRGIGRSELIFNTSFIKTSIIIIGIEMAINITVFAMAAAQPKNGIAQNTAIRMANVIKMVVIN